jgi:hypothetical protein
MRFTIASARRFGKTRAAARHFQAPKAGAARCADCRLRDTRIQMSVHDTAVRFVDIILVLFYFFFPTRTAARCHAQVPRAYEFIRRFRMLDRGFGVVLSTLCRWNSLHHRKYHESWCHPTGVRKITDITLQSIHVSI